MSAKPALEEPGATLAKVRSAPEEMPAAVSEGASLEVTRPAPRTVLVRAQSGWRLPDLAEVWRYRELFWVLAARDIKIRYKHTVLGIAWAIVQPFFAMIVFTVLSRFSSLSTDGARPEVFYYCGMLPWLLFANSLTSAGNSLIGGQHLITKVYFPRLVVPAASVITALIDFAIASVVLMAIMLFFRVAPAPQIVLLPVFVVLASAAALGSGLWLSALNVRFRDVRHIVPFLMQIWLFCSPVLYSSTSVQGSWKRALLGLNPISGAVDGVRWCVLGRPAPGPMLALSTATTFVVLLTSLFYFQRVERTLADRL
jgi:lipopolysaccharide transport system permease protein